MMKYNPIFLISLLIMFAACEKEDENHENPNNTELPEIEYVYTIVGTNQSVFYDNDSEIDRPAEGEEFYGQNAHFPGRQANYRDNGDGTVTDMVTGLMWQADLPELKYPYEEAVTYAESSNLAGYDDWRLPDAKELQSIVDYSRSPDATDTPAIDPLFSVPQIEDEWGDPDYPFYWTSTTHVDGPTPNKAVYVAFGRALGFFPDGNTLQDVHGAGAQRSDPKNGNPGDYPSGFGPQGDVIRIYNYVRCVRGM